VRWKRALTAAAAGLLISAVVTAGMAAVASIAAPGPSEASVKTGKPSDGDLRSRLTPMQFHVTQECGTEPPFRNE